MYLLLGFMAIPYIYKSVYVEKHNIFLDHPSCTQASEEHIQIWEADRDEQQGKVFFLTAKSFSFSSCGASLFKLFGQEREGYLYL